MNDLIMGIETSCDDTAVALVDKSGNVISSQLATQQEIHSKYGGIFPELASRAHLETILYTVNDVLLDIDISPSQIKAIGVTRGPGLIGSLLVGLNTASALGMSWSVPVIGINHLKGHLRSADLEEQRVKYPSVVLLVSGGHTILAFMQSKYEITILGSTRDDSTGEAYDKVGRMLGLTYPAGYAVDKLAMKGSPQKIKFPRPMIKEGYEFSFSGLKSAVARHIDESSKIAAEDIAASFVDATMDVLITKCKRALIEFKPISLVIVGGVSASPQLRSMGKEMCDEYGVELCLPPLKWSTDNAAMIALATWDYIDLGISPSATPELQLSLLDY